MGFASATIPTLLTAAEGPAVEVIGGGEGAARGVVFVCEHASNRIPAALGDLGLDAAARESHIAWDPGALAVAKRLADSFGAPLVAGRFSRLVYDCNRPPEAAGAIPERSEATDVPGNRGLDAAARACRIDEIYRPFAAALAQVVEDQIARGRPPAIVTIHSFTPVYLGVARAVEFGVLHDSDARLAEPLLARAPALTGLRTERNEPYGPQDGVTHTLKAQALPRGLPNVMLEIRNDLIAEAAAQARVADALSGLLREGLDALGSGADATLGG